MALKSENEQQLSHRIFKFYKATGVFPPDKTPLESYRLLAKYNYFIAADLDKDTINKLTEICNILDRERVLLVFGDFLLETLYFGLKSFKYSRGKSKIKIIYIDAIETKPEVAISTAVTTSTHLNNYIVYVIDNVDRLNVKSAKYLLKLRETLKGSNKSVVCCTMNIKSVTESFRTVVRRTRLGIVSTNEMTLKNYVYLLFNDNDKRKVLEILSNAKLSETYFISLITHNLPHFYKNNPNDLYHNIHVLEVANRLLYKATTKMLWKYIVSSFITTDIKRTIRFPPKKDKKAVIKRVKSQPKPRRQVKKVRRKINKLKLRRSVLLH